MNEDAKKIKKANKENDDARFKTLLEKGFSMGKLKYKTKEELHGCSNEQ
ncbi:hypothetical protein HY992_02920 [Candidatus Micrarchaeota archaeon]|nr:hypothetical protein [Candidatus Micrarchaeota archaeon]